MVEVLKDLQIFSSTVYSGYSGHVCSSLSDTVATFPGTKYIHSNIQRVGYSGQKMVAQGGHYIRIALYNSSLHKLKNG